VILSGGKSIERARFPATEIVATLRRAGFPSRLSNDAGDYLCNAALYLSLAASRARQIGFMHVPRLAKPRRLSSDIRPNSKPTLVQLTHAAELAVVVAARAARAQRHSDPKSARNMRQN
jgi:pyroglutamyl-peptidase